LITTVITFLTEKIVAVVITTVVVVAAVPSVILTINGNTITITPGVVASTSRHHDDDEHARIILEVKTAGDAVIIKLNNLQASCDSQIEQLASKSKLSATSTRSALDRGKNDFHSSVLPFIHEIEADEEEIRHLSVITVETEQAFLVRINTVLVLALGEDGQHGALVTVCHTIIVQITQIVVVSQAPEHDRDYDVKKAA
jgi:hypothetical protein